MKRVLFLILNILIFFTADAQSSYYLLIGTYTSSSPSEGIYVYSFDASSGAAKPVSVARNIANPSYLAVSPNHQYVYAVNEASNNKGSGGAVSSFRFNKKTGELKFLSRVPSGGDDPCYVMVHPDGKWVAVANYTSGSLGILPVQPDGSLAAPVVAVRHTGSGPNKARQATPHVHSTVFGPGGKFLYVAALGTDQEMAYVFDTASGLLSTPSFPPAHVQPGGGPRHFIFDRSGHFAYLVEEMGGVVSAFRVEGGRLVFLQQLSTLPKDFKGNNTSADIHISPDGRFLYASNRGESNSIAIFRINSSTGKLTPAGYHSSLGKIPRNFNIDPTGHFLLVANQGSNEVVIFRRDINTGMLTDTGNRISVGAPVCLKWIPR